jgi:nucleoside-diphosphate-sugar epimerase
MHVIIGAGQIGTATAYELVKAGHHVRMVTRSGSGPEHPDIEKVAADASDPARLTKLATGAAALYNCANPPYHRWPELWPPMAAAMLTAAERTGAVLVTMSNLYGYGPVDVPITEDLPLSAPYAKGQIRPQMWRDALAAHQAGRVRVTEARASDYVGRDGKSVFTNLIAPAVLAGKRAYAPVKFDLPHSLTFTGDAGRTLAVLGTDERAWGRAWHVPTAPATTLRTAATRLAELAGAPAPRLITMSSAVLRLGGLFNPEAREFVKVRYQFTRPFILDSSAAQEMFGLTPTNLDDALRTML